MDRVLVIYDATGRVWNIVYGIDEAPEGIPCVWCDLPTGARIDHVDTTTGEVIFEYLPETDLDRLNSKMSSILQDITDIQVAMTEIYETMLGNESL